MTAQAEAARSAARDILSGWMPGATLFIGNEWVPALSDDTRDVSDPSTGEPVHRVAEAGERDVDQAVRAAERARAGAPWARLSPFDRARTLRAVAAAIDSNRETLQLLESLDVGKPLEMAGAEVATAVECFEYFASLAVQIEGSNRHLDEGMALTRREPVGTVGIITPFNFPLVLSAIKIASALAAGCTVVHKPSEHTPLTALALGNVMLEADLPAGVYNVVTGEGATAGQALVRHPDVAKIVFTGSTEVGVRVAAEAARTVKRITMELGGKAANIVLPDADLDLAAPRSHLAYTFNSGQYCESGSRVLVEAGLQDELVARLAEQAGQTAVGDAFDPSSAMGPLIHQGALEAVHAAVERSLEAGADVVAGGQRREDAAGFFYPPTVITAAAPDSEIAQKEIFGPVVTVIPFDGVDEAVALANGTRFGLAAGVQSGDVGRAVRIAERLTAGTVWINDWGTGNLAIPVGGRKQSGLGREGGPEGLSEYLEYKSILVTL